MSSARRKLTGSSLDRFNQLHPRGAHGRFVRKGGAAARFADAGRLIGGAQAFRVRTTPKAARRLGEAGRPALPPRGRASVPPRGRAARFHTNVNDIGDLVHTVENVPVVRNEKLTGGAIGDTRLVHYANGKQIVWKQSGRIRDSDAEQLSSLVARALGMRAPRVYRARDDAVNMDYVDDADLSFIRLGTGLRAIPQQMLESDEGRMMGLLDQLINNTDRHGGNWMISDDGRLVPIDHGNAFPVVVEKTGDGQFVTWVKSPFADHYGTAIYNPGSRAVWRQNDLTPQDVAEIQRRIYALRPDFVHVGRGRWHDFMLERLQAIAGKAAGTRSRLLPPQLR